jgi:hypothetical protein
MEMVQRVLIALHEYPNSNQRQPISGLHRYGECVIHEEQGCQADTHRNQNESGEENGS